MSRPLVGVTGADRVLPWAWWFTRLALWRVGARAVWLTPDSPHPECALDALIIGGGDDIDPGLYLPEPTALAPINPARDRFEIGMLEQALKTELPLLGICRGAQLLNVVLGGSLHADLRARRRLTSNRRTLLASKLLEVEPGSRLETILGTRRCHINSLHHQAVDRLGDGLRVAGRDRDGIVQAVESSGPRFVLGVQWHPEYMPHHRRQLRVFSALRAAIPGAG